MITDHMTTIPMPLFYKCLVGVLLAFMVGVMIVCGMIAARIL